MRALIALLCWLIAAPALAFSPGQQVAMLAPQVRPVGGITAPYWFNFARGGNPVSNGTCATYGHIVPCILTTTRASVGYVNDAGGNWTAIPAGTTVGAIGASGGARISNLGLLVEEARTNSIRNNSMQGAVAGLLSAGGALPTNWGIVFGTSGLTTANVTIGTPTTIGNVDVLPITIAGTPTGTSAIALVIETTAVAVNGQTWFGSVFYSAAGTFGNVRSEIDELNAVGTFLAGGNSATVTPTASLQRLTQSYTNTNALAAFERYQFQFITTNGVALNGTYYVGWPQLELGASVTSPIRTTNAAATRAADVDTMTTPPTFGSAYSMYAKGTPQAPNAYGATQNILAMSDGSNNNRFTLIRTLGTGTLGNQITVATVGQTGPAVLGVLTQNTSFKSAMAGISSDVAMVLNGGAPNTATPSIPSGINTVAFGIRGDLISGTQFNSFLEQAAIFNAMRVTNGQLQSMTTGAQ